MGRIRISLQNEEINSTFQRGREHIGNLLFAPYQLTYLAFIQHQVIVDKGRNFMAIVAYKKEGGKISTVPLK
jgi:hypothetical protein